MNFFYKLLVSSFTLSIFSEGILLPIYAIFVQKIGGDILEASGAMAVFLITQGIFTVLVHRLRWSTKHRVLLLVSGWAIWTVGIASYLIISNIFTLFLTQILTALGNALADPVFDQELAEHTDQKAEQFEWGFFEGTKSLVEGTAAIIGGLIAVNFGFTVLILVMIATASASFGLILFYTLRTRRHFLGISF